MSMVEPAGGASDEGAIRLPDQRDGPELRFDKTEGLGPDGGHSLSVCLPEPRGAGGGGA